MATKKLPIKYNRNLRLAVLSEDHITYLVLDDLFDDLHFVTPQAQPWLQKLGLSASIEELRVPKGNSTDVKSLLKGKRFKDYTKNNPKIKFLLYSPLDPPYKVNPLVFLMNSPTIAHAYENKRYFRDEFSDLIRMPEYEIRYVDELDKAAAYKELSEELGEFVLQDEESSGSKGTYIIRNHDQYVEAVKSLKKFSQGRSVVISKFVEGETVSVQVCVNKYGIFTSAVQKQLLDSKYLCNPDIQGATKWCGGELGNDEFPDIVQHQCREIASIIGSELSSHGYKGIFGIDLIVSPDNEVYTIEINARLTGYSHIISDMQKNTGKIPFMLLHVLEQANIEYEVTDLDALPSAPYHKRPVTYMIVNNPAEESIILNKEIKPGLYHYKKGQLEYIRPANSISALKNEDHVLIFSRHKLGEEIERGKRVLKIIRLGKCMSKKDLNPKSRELVASVKKYFDLP